MHWFPDWSGETCAIIACGPSSNAEQAEKVRGQAKTIAINLAWTWAPWADVLYACDPQWWKCEKSGYGQTALREFNGLRVGYDGSRLPDGVRSIDINRNNEVSMSLGVLGGGANSGFQALNLAIQFGSRKILLIGYDMRDEKGRIHCHEDHPSPLGNPTPASLRRFAGAFNDAEAQIRALGVSVINCTPGSALTCFPLMPLEEALA